VFVTALQTAAIGRLLGEYWESTGRVLGEYWESIERVLGEYRELGEYWESIGKEYRESIGRVLGEFWGCIGTQGRMSPCGLPLWGSDKGGG